MLAPETSFTFIPVQSHFHPPPPVKLQWPCGCIAQWTCHTVTLLKREWFYGLSSLLLESSLIVLSGSTFLPLLTCQFLASVTISVPTASSFFLVSLTQSFSHHVKKPLTQLQFVNLEKKKTTHSTALLTLGTTSQLTPVPTPLFSRPLNGIFSRQNAQAEIWAPPLTFPLLSPTYTHVSRSLCPCSHHS